jgi:hypothetical protein
VAELVILYLFGVLLIMDDFSRPVILLEGAEKSFISRVAMLVFAFILCFIRGSVVGSYHGPRVSVGRGNFVGE